MNKTSKYITKCYICESLNYYPGTRSPLNDGDADHTCAICGISACDAHFTHKDRNSRVGLCNICWKNRHLKVRQYAIWNYPSCVQCDKRQTLDLVSFRNPSKCSECEPKQGLKCPECSAECYFIEDREGWYCPECGAKIDEKGEVFDRY